MAGWEAKAIGEVCTIKPSKAEARAKLADSDEVSFAPMEDLGIGEKYLQPRRTRRLGEVSGSYTYFADGDVLLAKITPCFENGKLGVARGLTNGIGFGSSEYIVLRPGAALDAQFLYYYLSQPTFKEEGARSMTGAVGHKRVTKEFVEGYSIPLPPLPEQRRLVAVLDEAFEAIAMAKANTEKSLLNAREVFESKLYALLGHDVAAWPKKTLREIAVDFGRGKSKHRPRNDPKLYGGPYPFIQTGDVRGAEHLITEYTQSYSEAGLAQSKLWPKGTLCITIAANIAETGVLNFDACFPDSIIGVVVDERQTSSKYLEYMLQTVKAHLKAKGKGSAQDNINLATFEDERFPFPGLDTQARVVSLLDNLSSRVQGFEELCGLKLIALEELKRSLLHQAFSGLLTVKSTDQQLEAVP